MAPLRRRMAEDMQVRNLSPLHAGHLHPARSRCSHATSASLPELLGPEHIRGIPGPSLATGKRLAPGSIAVAVAALRFLYGVTLQKDWNIPEVLPTPKQPPKLPVVPQPRGGRLLSRCGPPSSATASS